MYSTVFITAPSSDSARNLSRMLLERRLAACANIFPISSLYWWKGEIVEEGEHAVLLKTRTEDFKEIRKAVLGHHPYEVPCIVRYAISEGHDAYLEWIRESTERTRRAVH